MKFKKNLYHKYIINKSVPINIIISDADLNKLKTIAKKDSFLTAEDYIKSLIDINYESIDVYAKDMIKIKNPSMEYDNNIHDLKIHQLENPKLLRYKNDLKDTKQTTLEKYNSNIITELKKE